MNYWNTDQLECYELWDVTTPHIPPRSRLYRLEPIGVGTLHVESLSSYFVRLANAHCLQPKRLVSQEVLPLTRDLDQLPLSADNFNSWLHGSATVNGATIFTSRWVHALEQLTVQSNLRFLTMLTWNNVVHRRGLVKKTRTWCSDCYKEWQETGQIIYEPLMWCLSCVTACPLHQQQLSQRCPNRDCHKSIPLFADWSRPGYCPHCWCFLGFKDVVESDEIDLNEINANWVNSCVGELLVVAPKLTTVPSIDDLALKISLILRVRAKQDNVALAKKLGISASNLIGWQQGLHTMSFDVLLKLCYQLDVSPAQLLMSIEDSKKHGNWFLFEYDNTNIDIEEIKEVLRAYLEDSFPPVSLKHVAKQLGYSPGFLQYHCPDLCTAITKKYAARQKKTKPIERAVLQQELEHVLMSNEPLPPLMEIAGRLDCTIATLQRHFPHLCKEILERRRSSTIKTSGRVSVSLPVKETLQFEITKDLETKHQQSALNAKAQEESLHTSLIRNEDPPCISHRKASRNRLTTDEIDRIEKTLETILSNNESSPTMKQIAQVLGYSYVTLRKHFPDLCNQIVNRNKNHLDINYLRQSLDFILESDEYEHFPSLTEIAKNLNCSRYILKYYFPSQYSEILNLRNERNNLNWQERVLHEALLSDEYLPLKAIAKKLGCHCKILRKRFPELCQSVEERYEKSFDSGWIEKALGKALEDDITPPSISEIAKSLGYPEKILERYYPGMCSEIFKRRLLRLDTDHLRVALEAFLVGEEPLSMSEVSRRLGYSCGTLSNHFPKLCSAISSRYQIFRRQRKQERVEKLCLAVQEATMIIHDQGKRPTSTHVSSMIGGGVHFRIPEVRQAWHQKMKELGYEW